jgi:16S rRNA (cytosine967-C5)-methyltransferase
LSINTGALRALLPGQRLSIFLAMRYIWQHIQLILESYHGEVPLAHFLKNYFGRHPKLGSRDRKILSAMAYSWYRCSKGVTARGSQSAPNEDVIKNCLRLCHNDNILRLLKEEPGTEATHIPFDVNTLFPFDISLSDGITREAWLSSMLVQPELFIRIRKDKKQILTKLNEQGISHTFITDACVSLPNGSKLDALLPPESYVIQDASSQQTGQFFAPEPNESWYDCCSGAGGKSLLLKDLEPGVRLTVSDKRASIIHNLQQRFRQYHLQLPTAHVLDVTQPAALEKALGNMRFDNILCDAPCSGSGTWARTPEQLYFFDPATLEKFNLLQSTIAVNVSKYLTDGGRLTYITCSVFKRENEDVVAEITKRTGLQPVRSKLINGTHIHADSMFICELKKA